VVEPHEAVIGDIKRKVALNMTSRASMDCQSTSTDIVKQEPRKVMNLLKLIRPAYQRSLKEWMPEARWKEHVVDVLSLPRRLNWKAVKKAYEFQPEDYEELLGIRGIGPATVRGLALISELVYGDAPSWKDPVKYSFAYGGKDGVPHPVDREAMDKSIEVLETAINNARIGNRERIHSLQRLRRYVIS